MKAVNALEEDKGPFFKLNLGTYDKKASVGYRSGTHEFSFDAGCIKGPDGSLMKESPYTGIRYRWSGDYNTSAFTLGANADYIHIQGDPLFNSNKDIAIESLFLSGYFGAGKVANLGGPKLAYGGAINCEGKPPILNRVGAVYTEIALGGLLSIPVADNHDINIWSLGDWDIADSSLAHDSHIILAPNVYRFGAEYDLRLPDKLFAEDLKLGAEYDIAPVNNTTFAYAKLCAPRWDIFARYGIRNSTGVFFPSEKILEYGLGWRILPNNEVASLTVSGSHIDSEENARDENLWNVRLVLPLGKSPTSPSRMNISGEYGDRWQSKIKANQAKLYSWSGIPGSSFVSDVAPEVIDTIITMPDYNDFLGKLSEIIKRQANPAAETLATAAFLTACVYDSNYGFPAAKNSQEFYNAMRTGLKTGEKLPAGRCDKIGEFIAEMINSLDIEGVSARPAGCRDMVQTTHTVIAISTPEKKIYILAVGYLKNLVLDTGVTDAAGALYCVQQRLMGLPDFVHKITDENGKHLCYIVTPEGKILKEALAASEGERAGDRIPDLLKRVTARQR